VTSSSHPILLPLIFPNSRADSLSPVVAAIATLVNSITDLNKQLQNMQEQHLTQVLGLQQEIAALRGEVAELRKVTPPAVPCSSCAQLPPVEMDQVGFPTLGESANSSVPDQQIVGSTNQRDDYANRYQPPSMYSAMAGRPAPALAPVSGHSRPRHHGRPNGTHPPFSAERAQQTKVTSYYHRPPKAREDLCARPKCHALKVERFDSGCTADSLVAWCEKKDVEIIKCSVTESPSSGSAFAHVVIARKDKERVFEKGFWPDYITVRDWKFKSDRIVTEQNQHHDT